MNDKIWLKHRYKILGNMIQNRVYHLKYEILGIDQN